MGVPMARTKQDPQELNSSVNIVKKRGARTIFAFLLLALFFTAVISIFNGIVNHYAKRSIQQESEWNSILPAEEFEKYLMTARDFIVVAEYTISEQIRNKCPEEEIMDYLIKKSKYSNESGITESNGLYGYINGKYMDGIGWNPGEDFDAKTRPWYQQAIQNPGKITLISPYLDRYSGEMVMTVAMSLADGESVIAVDMTTTRAQEIIESAQDERLSAEATRMIIGNNGVVVAHTDKTEIGRNYREEKDTLGGRVIEKVDQTKDNSFEITYHGNHYIASYVTFDNGWYCIAVVEAKEVYQPIRVMIAVGIVAVLITFVIFLIITIRTEMRDRTALKLQSILSSSADIYMSLCELDVINNTVEEIKNVNPAIHQAVMSCDHNMKEIFLGIMKGLPPSDTKDAAVAFTDLSTIDERMKDTDIATLEYLSYGEIWVRARFVVSARTAEGKVARVLWMLENIDEERKNREHLITLSERALAASEAKSAFLSNMSHEIRTPINSILGFNEMVSRETRESNVLEYSKNIRSAGDTLLGIINDILDFSKIESGKLELIEADYDLASLLNDLVNMTRARIGSKDLRLILRFDPDMPEGLYGDDVRIKQIITNILTNAVKYTEKGSVTFRVGHEKIEGDQDHVNLKVSVEDTGIGIKREDLSKIFSEFERVDQKKTRSIEGTGLGMSITQSLLSMMGSKLEVESIYGEGSVFSFTLLQKVINWDPIGDYERAYEKYAKNQERYNERFQAPDARVLIVDDTQMNLVVFAGLLKKTGVKIDTALSGDEGIRMAKMRRYDMIFLDHMMPSKDGIETLQEMRRLGAVDPETPVICLTANAISGAKEFYLEAGFTDYLSKPIDPKALEEMMYEYLPKHKITSEGKDESSRSEQELPGELFHILELDVASGVATLGSEDLYRKVLRGFPETIDSIITSIKAYREEDQYEDVLAGISSVIDVADTIGATWIGKKARELEAAGDAGDKEQVYTGLTELLSRCRELRDKVVGLDDK